MISEASNKKHMIINLFQYISLLLKKSFWLIINAKNNEN